MLFARFAVLVKLVYNRNIVLVTVLNLLLAIADRLIRSVRHTLERTMTRRCLFSLAVLLSCCTLPCWAQNRGGTSGGFSSGGTTGGFGGTSTGGFGGGSSSGGFGGTSASTGTFGQRSLGSGVSAQSGSAFRSGGQQGNNNVGSPGQVGLLDGNERFSRNRAAGQFVGADTADTANMMGIMAGQQNAALQGLARSLNQMNPNQQNRQQQNTRRTVRSVKTIEFEYQTPAAAVLNQELSKRLTNIKSLGSVGNIQVEMSGRTAKLSGTVANEHARDLAARLCLLEPGVSKVENLLVVPEELPANSPADSSRAVPAPPVPMP
jgi:osmotically-inducible protein OsmY